MRNPTSKTNADEPVQNDRCTVFLSRFINILLMNTGLTDVSVYICYLSVLNKL